MNSLFFSLFISRTFVIVIVIDRIYHTIIDSIPLIIFIYLFIFTHFCNVIVIDKIDYIIIVSIIILNRQKIVHALHKYYTGHKGHVICCIHLLYTH